MKKEELVNKLIKEATTESLKLRRAGWKKGYILMKECVASDSRSLNKSIKRLNEHKNIHPDTFPTKEGGYILEEPETC